MKPYYQDRQVTLYNCDARTIPLPDASVQCCVTSPPYWGLRDYGTDDQLGLEATPEEYVANMVEVFREVRRVLANDGTLWLNLGDCYATGAGKVGDCPGGGAQGEGWQDRGGSGTQPNRMPQEGLKPKDLVGIPWRVAFALQADGWWLRSDIIWHKPNPMPESVTDRPTKAHEYLFLLSKSASYFYDAEAIAENGTFEPGTRRRAFTAPRAQAMGRQPSGNEVSGWVVESGKRNKRSVWTVPTQPYPGAHFAVFPPALIKPCILAGCPEGGPVLDPFGGAGTTAFVAKELGRKAVGCDLSADYLGLARGRLAQEVLPL